MSVYLVSKVGVFLSLGSDPKVGRHLGSIRRLQTLPRALSKSFCGFWLDEVTTPFRLPKTIARRALSHKLPR